MDFLIERFKENLNKSAFIFNNQTYSYNWFLDKIQYFHKIINENKLSKKIIFLNSTISPESIAFLLSSIKNKIIIIPSIVEDIKNNTTNSYLIEICKPNVIIDFDKEVKTIHNSNIKINHKLYNQLIEENNAGLVLFSSGTTGEKKAVLHNFELLLNKYRKVRKDHSTFAFMFYDHIGGIDTLFYSLSNCSTLLLTQNRTPKYICSMIEQWKIEVLPTTPSFLNLIILSEEYKNYNLSSLKYITYGTEVMPIYTLSKLNQIFPNVEVIQKFGATEVGTLGSKSLNSNSQWMKLGGEGFNVRIVDDKLEIQAKSSMLGYLNAPSPFTEDGWYQTGDLVEEKDGYLRIIGRESSIINVGGEKVNPIEVESTLKELDFIEDVLVFGEKNEIVGNIIIANIKLTPNIPKTEALVRIKEFARENLPKHKRPVKFKFVTEELLNTNFKKDRKSIP